jgi:hypothetical protein
MFPTVEVRWFSTGKIPDEVADWFQRPTGVPGDQQTRVDHYLRFEEGEAVGIKLREGRIEVKQRYRRLGLVHLHERAAGQVDHWRKWGFEVAGGDADPGLLLTPASSWIGIEKERRLRRYRIGRDGRITAVPVLEMCTHGCDLELTRLAAEGADWWTIGLEAFGEESILRDHLLLAAEFVFGTEGSPVLEADDSASYPEWLMKLG